MLSLAASFRLFVGHRIASHQHPLLPVFCARNYATMKKKSQTSAVKIEKAPLNMDVCLGANYYKTGEDPVIRPEEEYPEWLWNLDPEKQMDVAPDSKQYWRKIRKKEAHRVIATLRERH
jgi:large subunit ribosomal protein L54